MDNVIETITSLYVEEEGNWKIFVIFAMLNCEMIMNPLNSQGFARTVLKKSPV
jgi:hypothetical protein